MDFTIAKGLIDIQSGVRWVWSPMLQPSFVLMFQSSTLKQTKKKGKKPSKILEKSA